MKQRITGCRLRIESDRRTEDFSFPPCSCLEELFHHTGKSTRSRERLLPIVPNILFCIVRDERVSGVKNSSRSVSLSLSHILVVLLFLCHVPINVSGPCSFIILTFSWSSLVRALVFYPLQTRFSYLNARFLDSI